MGAQLLTQVDYDCESVLCTTELLKLRFGEAPLHACEVMLKDVADSKRANASIHTESKTLSKDVAPGLAASDFGDGPQPMLEETLLQASETVVMCSPTAAISEHARDTMELPADEIKLPLDNLSAAIISHMFWPAAEKNGKVKVSVLRPLAGCAYVPRVAETRSPAISKSLNCPLCFPGARGKAFAAV
eukprot:365123-Chlamydomonas_euryale.AAC.31